MRLARAALLILFAAPAAAEPGFVPIDITARPIASFSLPVPDTWLGEIEFRGGLVLSSPNAHFGAVSGIDIAPDGSLTAVLDTGFWLSARLVEENGRLTGIADAQLAPMLDEDGEEANRKSSTDAEGLRIDRARGVALVAFEQDHRVAEYDLADLAFARPRLIRLPTLNGVRGNQGIESVAIAPPGTPLAGATVLIAEAAGSSTGISGWIVGGPDPGTFAVRRSGSFDITDAAFLPNGDLFILERLFSLSQGVAMRIRRLSSADLANGTANGPTVLMDDNLFQIDNMEGLALRPQEDGTVLITIASDDNHNLLQRTMLLQFAWRDETPPLPLARPTQP